MSDWNWHGEVEKEEIIIPRVDAIAVYQNGSGDIVIRQQDSMGDEDSTIIIPRMHAQSIVDAILRQMNNK